MNKIIFWILGLIILIELLFAVWVLKAPLPSPTPPSASLPIRPKERGEIQLLSSKKNYQVGEMIPLTIRVSTGGQPTFGTDLILRFDPKILEASSSAIKPGNIYSEYPLVNVNPKNGIISISGITRVGQTGFEGVGVLATLNLKAKKAGVTTLSVDFKPGSTADSNIIEAKTVKDILRRVQNLELVIR